MAKQTFKTKAQLSTLPARQLIREFVNSHRQTVKHCAYVAAVYVQLLDRFPDKVDDLKYSAVEVAKDTWWRLEMIGRGHMLPEFALTSQVRARRCRWLPLSEQKRLIYHGCPVYTGYAPHSVLRLSEMTTPQVEQVVSGPSLRTLAQQEQYLRDKAQAEEERQRARRERETQAVRVWFEDGRLKSDGPINMTVKEVMDLMELELV